MGKIQTFEMARTGASVRVAFQGSPDSEISQIKYILPTNIHVIA